MLRIRLGRIWRPFGPNHLQLSRRWVLICYERNQRSCEITLMIKRLDQWVVNIHVLPNCPMWLVPRSRFKNVLAANANFIVAFGSELFLAGANICVLWSFGYRIEQYSVSPDGLQIIIILMTGKCKRHAAIKTNFQNWQHHVIWIGLMGVNYTCKPYSVRQTSFKRTRQ